MDLPSSFTPENPLEESLMKAATQPEHRPAFLKEFLDAQIFIIDDRTPEQRSARHGDRLQEGSSLPLRTLEYESKPHLPIFSAPIRLQELLHSSEPVACLMMAVRDFLTMTRGAEILLNPGSQYGKRFTKEEIAWMLEGDGEITLKEATEVLLAQPSEPPEQLLSALSGLFHNYPEVNEAYMCLVARRGEEPHTLIAIDCQGGFEKSKVREKLGLIIEATHVLNPPVDFVDIKSTKSVDGYFKKGKIKPFYLRRKPLFGLGR